MFGFYNRILTIDLTDETFEIEHVSDNILEKNLGGKGLATYLLLKKNPVGVDPLSPDNHLIFATGQFCQSRIWGASRYGVYTKSPLTGFYAESYSGGRVPEAIDACGFDAILFKGKASRPISAYVHPDGARFHGADDLWGASTFKTEQEVIKHLALPKSEGGKVGAVVIGPAGEKKVAFAMIANDKWRCAGRAGTGAVMGSKLLKAIVFQGNQKRPISKPETLNEYCKQFSKKNINHPGVKAYKALGTTMMVSLMNSVGAFPTQYWS